MTTETDMNVEIGPQDVARPASSGRTWGIVLIVLGLALIAIFGFGWTPAPGISSENLPVAPEVGALGPEISLVDTRGNAVRLSELKGKKVLINFWATWCGPCRIEMPYLQARFEANQDELVLLAVNFDEPFEEVVVFQQEFGLTFPVLLDPGGLIQQTYQIKGYPTSYFLDEEGVIRAVHIGIMTESQLDGYLDQIGVQ